MKKWARKIKKDARSTVALETGQFDYPVYVCQSYNGDTIVSYIKPILDDCLEDDSKYYYNIDDNKVSVCIDTVKKCENIGEYIETILQFHVALEVITSIYNYNDGEVFTIRSKEDIPTIAYKGAY